MKECCSATHRRREYIIYGSVVPGEEQLGAAWQEVDCASRKNNPSIDASCTATDIVKPLSDRDTRIHQTDEE